MNGNGIKLNKMVKYISPGIYLLCFPFYEMINITVRKECNGSDIKDKVTMPIMITTIINSNNNNKKKNSSNM